MNEKTTNPPTPQKNGAVFNNYEAIHYIVNYMNLNSGTVFQQHSDAILKHLIFLLHILLCIHNFSVFIRKERKLVYFFWINLTIYIPFCFAETWTVNKIILKVSIPMYIHWQFNTIVALPSDWLQKWQFLPRKNTKTTYFFMLPLQKSGKTLCLLHQPMLLPQKNKNKTLAVYCLPLDGGHLTSGNFCGNWMIHKLSISPWQCLFYQGRWLSFPGYINPSPSHILTKLKKKKKGVCHNAHLCHKNVGKLNKWQLKWLLIYK